MEYVKIKLTYDELTYVLKILVDLLETAVPSEKLDILDIIKVFLEQSND